MTSLFDQLNLRPQERRLIVIVGFVVFVVLNVAFVWPRFGDWQIVKGQKNQVERTLRTYQEEIGRRPIYESKLKVLQATGTDVLSQELQLQRIIQTEAAESGVMITRWDPRSRPSAASGRVNQFFGEQSLVVDCNTGPQELVKFLVNVASGNSMIRVSDMNLKPDPSQTRLLATITFVASYEKKTPDAKPAAGTRLTAHTP